MRILHISTYDNIGGVARAALRLHKGMIDAGHDSHFLCVRKDTDVNNVHVVTKNRYKFKVINKIIRFYRSYFISKDTSILEKLNQKYGYFPFTLNSVTTNFLYDIKKINPDIIHIHWINDICRIEDVKKINIPIVWNLHDTSVFTGGCHVINECTKYQTHCGACPLLHSTIEHDLSHKIFERKLRNWMNISSLSVISSSNWMANNARQSTILKSRNIDVIPTGLDCDFFNVNNKNNTDSTTKSAKRVLLFGANGALTDKNKGFELLVRAINENCSLFSDCEMWVFGNDSTQINTDLQIDVVNLGFPNNESMPEIYRNADITIVPSFQECFGQVTIESMACGTPVAAFAATGLLDTVSHLLTGYLAKPYDTNDLAVGIRWVLDNNTDNHLGVNARNRVVSLFEMTKVVQQNIDYYKSVLNASKD